MTKIVKLSDPCADELLYIVRDPNVVMSQQLRDEVFVCLYVPPVDPNAFPVFPASVPGFDRIITRTWGDMAKDDWAEDFSGLAPTDLIIIAARAAGQDNARGELSIAPYPGTVPQQRRTVSLTKSAGLFEPRESCRTDMDPVLQFVLGVSHEIQYLYVGMEIGTGYYFSIKSLTGPPCDMRIRINRPR